MLLQLGLLLLITVSAMSAPTMVKFMGNMPSHIKLDNDQKAELMLNELFGPNNDLQQQTAANLNLLQDPSAKQFYQQFINVFTQPSVSPTANDALTEQWQQLSPSAQGNIAAVIPITYECILSRMSLLTCNIDLGIGMPVQQLAGSETCNNGCCYNSTSSSGTKKLCVPLDICQKYLPAGCTSEFGPTECFCNSNNCN